MCLILQINALLDLLEWKESAGSKGHFALYKCLVIGHTKHNGIPGTLAIPLGGRPHIGLLAVSETANNKLNNVIGVLLGYYWACIRHCGLWLVSDIVVYRDCHGSDSSESVISNICHSAQYVSSVAAKISMLQRRQLHRYFSLPIESTELVL
jgi:hypothetical protein